MFYVKFWNQRWYVYKEWFSLLEHRILFPFDRWGSFVFDPFLGILFLLILMDIILTAPNSLYCLVNGKWNRWGVTLCQSASAWASQVFMGAEGFKCLIIYSWLIRAEGAMRCMGIIILLPIGRMNVDNNIV